MDIVGKKELILEYIKTGEDFQTSCKRASVHRQTGWRWRKDDQGFDAEVQNALAGPTTEQMFEITNRLRNCEDIAKILKDMGLSSKAYARWRGSNPEFRRKTDSAIQMSKGLPAPVRDPAGGLPHGGFYQGEDELGRRMYKQAMSDLASLEQQKANLNSDPLTWGLVEYPGLDARIMALRDRLNDHAINQRLVAAHEPEPKLYPRDTRTGLIE